MVENTLFKEYGKFIGKEVTVKYHEGDGVVDLKGELVFLNFSYLNCVVKTKQEKIIVKNIITISRSIEK